VLLIQRLSNLGAQRNEFFFFCKENRQKEKKDSEDGDFVLYFLKEFSKL